MSTRWGFTNDSFLRGLLLMRGLSESINARGFSSRRGDVTWCSARPRGRCTITSVGCGSFRQDGDYEPFANSGKVVVGNRREEWLNACSQDALDVL